MCASGCKRGTGRIPCRRRAGRNRVRTQDSFTGFGQRLGCSRRKRGTARLPCGCAQDESTPNGRRSVRRIAHRTLRSAAQRPPAACCVPVERIRERSALAPVRPKRIPHTPIRQQVSSCFSNALLGKLRRSCRCLFRAPTRTRIIELFGTLQRHILLKANKVIQQFHPELTALQKKILKLIGISRNRFLITYPLTSVFSPLPRLRIPNPMNCSRKKEVLFYRSIALSACLTCHSARVRDKVIRNAISRTGSCCVGLSQNLWYCETQCKKKGILFSGTRQLAFR